MDVAVGLGMGTEEREVIWNFASILALSRTIMLHAGH
jgi:hypothetical protein